MYLYFVYFIHLEQHISKGNVSLTDVVASYLEDLNICKRYDEFTQYAAFL